MTILFVTATALAGSGHDARSIVTHIFNEADSDGNGTLSPDEYAAAALERYGVRFEDCDRDANGETTLEEYLELYESHHETDPGMAV
jgi:hypothetical protein